MDLKEKKTKKFLFKERRNGCIRTKKNNNPANVLYRRMVSNTVVISYCLLCFKTSALLVHLLILQISAQSQIFEMQLQTFPIFKYSLCLVALKHLTIQPSLHKLTFSSIPLSLSPSVCVSLSHTHIHLLCMFTFYFSPLV